MITVETIRDIHLTTRMKRVANILIAKLTDKSKKEPVDYEIYFNVDKFKRFSKQEKARVSFEVLQQLNITDEFTASGFKYFYN